MDRAAGKGLVGEKMNLKVVFYVLSRLQFAVTVSLCIPLVMALLWQEACAVDFAGTILVSLGIGVALHNNGSLEHESLTIREAIAVTGLSWILISLVASLPFLASHSLNVMDSIFEGISGLTCTGASVVRDIEGWPRSLVLWRSLTHWLGGLGIIVIFLAIFPQPGSGAAKMFAAESSGISDVRVVPRIKEASKALLEIYIVLSGVLALLLILCGINVFDAINLSMSALSTGGFAVTNASIAAYDSLPAELLLILFMLIGGGNFGLYFLAMRKGWKYIFRNTEMRVYLALTAVTVLLVAVNLICVMGMAEGEALRLAGFQLVSVVTTTGFATGDFNHWPAFSQFAIILLMLTGGCAGSTSGGIKISRIIILWKMAGTIVREKLHPNSIARVTMESQSQSSTVVFRVARFFFLYIMIALLAACAFNFDGLPVADAIMLGLSCMGNAGVAFGAAYTFYDLPVLTKLVCCLCMLIGRLEIFTFLAMLQPGFWKRDSNW